MSEITIQDKKVITPKFRVSFPALDKPKSFRGQDAKYEVTMLFDKKTDLDAPALNKAGDEVSVSLKQAVKNAIIEKWGVDPKGWPSKTSKSGKRVSDIRTPFHDGDVEKPDQLGYENTIYVRAWSKADKPPGCIDRERQPLDPKQIYAGCYARASLIAFAYGDAKSGIKPGVSFSLQNMQKIGDGEKFSGKKNAADEFEVAEDESDLPENYAPAIKSRSDADDSDDDSAFA